MENPEEILHSLEEFAKMKPKDIPRELEEYLKFVAKTGDPVYQWSEIKSLFREKLINVITEFYESCSSMEIPPCPNVEMFNYDLMKNFILEKLDTFASAPFTLQRICELLTSPRKEYTRIDKYMRALEKNILVVSTMEPGGRRTENGDGVMNGIESDHEHVPEPGNEINVEEMDDSPSWPQNIQTNNHIADPIAFENPEHPEHEYHVSSTNQEIVCVQYVSVEPLASEGLQIPNEEVKESDISVTITALKVKKDNEKPEEITSEMGTESVINVQQDASEAVDKQGNDKTETETNMDLQVEEPTESVLKDTSKDNSDSVSSSPLSEDILSTTTSESITESNQLQAALSLDPENAETENISPETSLTSEDLIQSNVSSTATCDHSLETTNISVDSLEISEATEINNEIKKDAEILETDSPGDIDSTIKLSEDDHVNEDAVKITSISEKAIPEVQSKEDPPFTEDSETSDVTSSPACDVTFENKLPEESSTVESSMEVSAPQDQFDTAEVTPDDVSKSNELDDPSSDVPAEADSILISEEKETVMEVSDIPEDTADSNNKKDKPVLEELKISDPPV